MCQYVTPLALRIYCYYVIILLHTHIYAKHSLRVILRGITLWQKKNKKKSTLHTCVCVCVEFLRGENQSQFNVCTTKKISAVVVAQGMSRKKNHNIVKIYVRSRFSNKTAIEGPHMFIFKKNLLSCIKTKTKM